MDTKTLVESDSVTMASVRASPTKRLVILSSGQMALDREGKQKFGVLVDMDGTQKLFRPNKTTMKALQAKYGTESQAWVGKTLTLEVGISNGKEAIIGTPV
jgi:hypothetical protein